MVQLVLVKSKYVVSEAETIEELAFITSLNEKLLRKSLETGEPMINKLLVIKKEE